MKLGDMNVALVDGGSFKLDGGAMHGVVPKTVWSRLTSCDEHNRCSYATNCLLVETRGRRVLVETGNGAKFPPKERDLYGIEAGRSIETALAEIGVEPASIDVVVMTHLHFDHAGGATRRTASGALAPVFPRARHVVQRRELFAAEHPHERNRASYLAENFAPLVDAHLVDVVDGEAEVAPGVRVLPSPGHTPGHQSVLLDDGAGTKLLFFGDVVPTAVHLRLPWVMAYDLDVTGTLESKRALLARAVAEKWIVAFGHELGTRAGRLAVDDKGNAFVEEPVALTPS